MQGDEDVDLPGAGKFVFGYVSSTNFESLFSDTHLFLARVC